MKQILCIVGPTGTGKTNLALKLSAKYPSVLISADSRQVYRGMDIVTGKDHPAGVDIRGIDIVNPDEECSVAVWHDSVSSSLSSDGLPIVVGGTGLYVKALTDGIPTMKIPINQGLRDELNPLLLSELQSRLQSIDPDKYTSMNNSDRQNPRRLIRAIEVAMSPPKPFSTTYSSSPLIIGLSFSDSAAYKKKVVKRVLERIKLGAVEETKKLLEKYDRNLPSMTAIGYRSLIQYLEGKLTEEQMIKKWTADELSYAKRQMTWFRKVPNLHWFDARDPASPEKIAKLVAKWYAKK